MHHRDVMDDFKLLDGTLHPAVGFGTYKVGVIPSQASGQNGVKGYTGKNIKEVVSCALDAGYTMLDCAAFYENEKEIGEALAKHPAKDKVYICSKVWTSTIYRGREAIREDVDRMLTDLGVPCLDLLLLHWPVPGKHVEAFKALQELKKEGKVRSIGVSNYTIEDYKELVSADGVEKPVVNQIEVNPFLFRQTTIKFFQDEGVLVQAYRPLGAGKKLDHPKIVELAKKHDVTPAQVLVRFLLECGICPLPKSETPERIKLNKEVAHFKLTPADVDELMSLTTQEARDANINLYFQCIVRDTPIVLDEMPQVTSD
eukprot:TRINITY_DN4549_c0_g1_i2.p2 TRINITY_DN4549_c0_g1~~TRINITY_DN4549_c0_g1_i2.p2  ORF type:complete len:314 (+),score=143.53 TRINITY_DN4549_c0_g1_i2:1607-2548(+)